MGTSRIRKAPSKPLSSSEKMEYLAEVRDGSEGTIGKGNWLCEVIGCEVGSNEITPLAQELWSRNAPDFKSENDQILSVVQKIRQASSTIVIRIAMNNRGVSTGNWQSL